MASDSLRGWALPLFLTSADIFLRVSHMPCTVLDAEDMTGNKAKFHHRREREATNK